MNVQNALGNITTVIEKALMNGPERDQLRADITLVAQRCKLADDLEKANVGAEELEKESEELKKPELKPGQEIIEG